MVDNFRIADHPDRIPIYYSQDAVSDRIPGLPAPIAGGDFVSTGMVVSVPSFLARSPMALILAPAGTTAACHLA